MRFRFNVDDFNACRERGRDMVAFPGGWVSDGVFALLLDGVPIEARAVAAESPGGRLLAFIQREARLPAVERRAWRIKGCPASVKAVCATCKGEGSLECDLGETHECASCRGLGGHGVVTAVAGQVVIDAVGEAATPCWTVAGRFYRLFDAGLTVCVIPDRTGAILGRRTPAQQAVIGLVDTDGTVVAIVCPILDQELQVPAPSRQGATR